MKREIYCSEKYLRIEEVSKLTGFGLPRLRRLRRIDPKLLPFKKIKGYILYDKEKACQLAERVKDHRNDAISREEAAQMIGITARCLGQAKRYKPKLKGLGVEHIPYVVYKGRCMYKRGDVELFIEKREKDKLTAPFERDEVLEILGICERTLIRWCRLDKIDFQFDGHRKVYSRDDVEKIRQERCLNKV